MQEQSIFIEALEREDPAERTAFLDQACGSDPALRQRIERLLHRHGQSGSFLDSPVLEPVTTIEERLGEGPGTLIGPYRLLEPLGEGGFGVVFFAEQQAPIRRQVALKVLKPGMDTRQVVARFEAERQALALMDHPNIAHVFDGGATESGRPYFVMELVKGVPITDYCDQNRLTPRQRLELFVSVCQAVQHAHQKGVIHRDLKPSNVLVTVQEGLPLVKVIDFGIAKATGPRLTERTVFTQPAQMIGTPLYMSPEQTGLAQLDVDTRSDIYTLGVLLYELLTGTTPFERERLAQAGVDEIRRIIREEEPPRPSTRVGSLGEAAAVVSAQRQSDPKRLGQLFRGEIDWIVMKCLEKDRSRRYETASALAADVQRYLHDEPVQACPPSRGYRLRKALRKHRVAVLTAAAFIGLLLAGGAFSTWQAVQATRAKKLAQARLGQVEKANDVLVSMFRDITPAAEDQGGPSLREQLSERLLVTAGELNEEAIGDPETLARTRHVLGLTLGDLGQHKKAIELLEKARAERTALLGPDDPDTLLSTSKLGMEYLADGRPDRAVPLLEHTLERRQATLGPLHPATLRNMDGLAQAYLRARQREKAIRLFEDTLEKESAQLGRESRDTLTTMNNLALAYQDGGRLDRAIPLFEQVLEIQKTKQGPDHYGTLNVMSNLALAYHLNGQMDKALPLSEYALEARKARLGLNHPATLISLTNLAGLYMVTHHSEKAVPLLEDAVARFKVRLGPDHPRTLLARNNLAVAYDGADQLDKSIALYEETLEIQKNKPGLGPTHPDTLTTMNNLAAAYGRLGSLDRTVSLLEETLRVRQKVLGADHPDTLVTVSSLGTAYRESGRLSDAIAILEDGVSRARTRPGGVPANSNFLLSALAQTYDRAGRFTDAEPLHREYLERTRKKFGPTHFYVSGAQAGLALNLLKQKRYADAEPVARASLALRAKQPDDWLTASTQSVLGGALAGQKRYADAEPLLKKGYEGLLKHEADIPIWAKFHRLEALERVVELYEVTDQRDKAQAWRQKLAAARAAGKNP